MIAIISTKQDGVHPLASNSNMSAATFLTWGSGSASIWHRWGNTTLLIKTSYKRNHRNRHYQIYSPSPVLVCLYCKSSNSTVLKFHNFSKSTKCDGFNCTNIIQSNGQSIRIKRFLETNISIHNFHYFNLDNLFSELAIYKALNITLKTY